MHTEVQRFVMHTEVQRFVSPCLCNSLHLNGSTVQCSVRPLDIPSSNSNTPKCYKCMTVVGDSLPFLCGWGKKRIGKSSRAFSGSANREKMGTFSLSFLAVTLNIYLLL